MMKKITILGISCALSGAFPATSVAEEVLPALSQQVLAQFPQVDRNGDGKLTGREWTFIEKVILRRYPDADTNANGTLSRAEQVALAKRLGGTDTPETPTAESAAATPEQLAKFLKQYPESDANGDGKLSAKEAAAYRKALQNSRGQVANKRGPFVPDPGWKEEKFPEHAVCYLTPEQLMTQYGGDFPDLPKSEDGVLRVVGTGHSFMMPGYRTLPHICEAAGFTQPLHTHTGGGMTGSVRYKWEQENGIFQFDGKPLPKLLAAVSNAKWEAMIWGPYTGDRPEFYTCWIDFCEKYNPGMKFYLSDAWPAPGHVRKVFKLQANPESEAFFTEAVYDQLSADAIAGFGGLVKTLRESTKEVYILPTHAAMTEAAKRFLRGELPGFKGLYKVIGGKEPSIWRDPIGHIHPSLERLEGYVFYATLYGKSPELISEPIKFKNAPSFLSADLDKIFREIAWKAVVEHPLSGVADKNKNGIGDHLE